MELSRGTILYVNASGEISGAERSLLAMLDALDTTRWTPVVVAPEGALLQAVAHRGITTCPVSISPLSRAMALTRAWSVLRQLRKGKQEIAHIVRIFAPAIIHANTTQAMLYLPLRLPLPIIWQVRDLTPLTLLGDWLYSKASCVAAISTAVQHELLKYAHDHEKKIVLLPPAVDTTQFRPLREVTATRKALRLPVELPLIGMIAQFVAWKQHHLWLDALEQMASLHWHAVLAGADLHHNDAYLTSIRQRLATPPLKDRVTWLPWQGDMARLMGVLDMLVLPSRCEPFGRVLIEAMACQVPVIAVQGGGVSDIIIPGESGLLVADDSTALAEGMQSLLIDEALRKSLGQRGRMAVEQRFSLHAQRQQLTTLYTRLCAPAASLGTSP